MPHQCTECGRTFADGSKQMLAGCPDCGGNKFQFRPKGSVDVPETAPAESEPEPATAGQPSKPADPGKTRTTTLREWARKVTPGGGSAEAPTPDPSTSSPTSGSARRTAAASQSASGSSGASSASTEAEESTATSLESFADDQDDAESTGGLESTDSPEPTTGSEPSDDAETVDSSDHEDAAQADARSGVVGENELPDHLARDDERPPRDHPPEDHPSDDRVPENRPPENTPPENAPPGDATPEDHEPRPDLAQLREELNDQFESIKVVEPGQYELNLMELYDREEYIIALQENGRYVIEVPDAWDAVDT